MNNIVLCGFMGCGKTTVGKRLSQLTGAQFVDLDLYIEDKYDMTISEIFEKYGENTFREYEHLACKQFKAQQNTIISTGGGALTFERNAKVFENDFVVFLDCPFNVIKKRLENDSSRPLMNDNAESLYNQRRWVYQRVSNFTVDANNDIDEICKLIINKRG